MILLFIEIVVSLARSPAMVSHSCVLFADTPVYRVDSDGGTLFYVVEEIDGCEQHPERKYCLEMTSAFSEISAPKKFVCRECLFDTAPANQPTSYSRDAFIMFIAVFVWVATEFTLRNILCVNDTQKVDNTPTQRSAQKKEMTQIHGIEDYSQEVQDFVDKQFALHGNINELEFYRPCEGAEFRLSWHTANGNDPEDVYLSKMSFVAVKFTGDCKELRDVYTLKFSETPPNREAVPASNNNNNNNNNRTADKVQYATSGKLVGGSWNGYPMSEEISSHDALFAICKTEGVFIHGQRLVLRDGKWHMP